MRILRINKRACGRGRGDDTGTRLALLPSHPPSLCLHASIISALALAAIIDRHYYTSPSHEARHFLGRFFGLVCMSVAAAARGIMGSVLAVAVVAEAEKEGRKRGNQMMRVCCSCCRRLLYSASPLLPTIYLCVSLV